MAHEDAMYCIIYSDLLHWARVEPDSMMKQKTRDAARYMATTSAGRREYGRLRSLVITYEIAGRSPRAKNGLREAAINAINTGRVS